MRIAVDNYWEYAYNTPHKQARIKDMNLMDTAQREGTRLQSPSVSHKRLPPCSCDPEITMQ